MIDGPAGPLEVVLNVPDASFAGIALLAHPHPQQGGTLDNKVVQTLAKTFFSMSYVAVRWNFRGVGKSAGVFDNGIGETDDVLAALAYARSRFGEALPVALGGFSFGAFVQTRVAQRVAEDTIVVHGEEDDVVPLADVLAWARPQELPIIVFPGCGHFFHGRLPQLARTVTAIWRGGTAPS